MLDNFLKNFQTSKSGQPSKGFKGQSIRESEKQRVSPEAAFVLRAFVDVGGRT